MLPLLCAGCPSTAVELPAVAARWRLYMPLSDAVIGNLERLSKCIDAGSLNDQRHKESIKNQVVANRAVDEQFWSHVGRFWIACCSTPDALSRPPAAQQINESVEALVR